MSSFRVRQVEFAFLPNAGSRDRRSSDWRRWLRLKPKIENVHVIGNDGIGDALLSRLRRDGVLSLSGNFYFLDPENVNKHLGISWLDL